MVAESGANLRLGFCHAISLFYRVELAVVQIGKRPRVLVDEHRLLLFYAYHRVASLEVAEAIGAGNLAPAGIFGFVLRFRVVGEA